ncbi:hypothetical protein N7465_011082 [Penicillium sp. CMV-2018d]|nr:hypothetical protein N7465_011082 [Penicillium sp. CMV-2018d]
MKPSIQLLCHWFFRTNKISNDALGRDKEVIHSVRYQCLVKTPGSEESAQVFHNSGVDEREAQKVTLYQTVTTPVAILRFAYLL